MSANWTIVSAAPARGFHVHDENHNRIAVIEAYGDDWKVHFIHKDELNFKWGGKSALDVCVGYVRGIERARQIVTALAW